MTRLRPAVLALEDGRVFRGRSLGASGRVDGEVVFTTAMTGYQEVLSDPSYAGQIITFTYPLIGNVGVNDVDMESRKPHCQGLVLRSMSRIASNHRATATLTRWLAAHGLPAIEGIDTRALTRHIRERGAMRAVLAAGEALADPRQLVAAARRAHEMTGRDLTARVAGTNLRRFLGTGAGKRWDSADWDGDPFAPGTGKRILVLDFGVKEGILETLIGAGARVVVAPARTGAERLLSLAPDAIVVSNGPGDPAAVGYGIDTVSRLLGRLPLLGICLGHQLLALALGMPTMKLKFGHHGVNHPVRDHATGRVRVTSQNHGFAVAEVPVELQSRVRVTHTSLVDNTIEGLEAPDLRARSIQFHPEASPGPHDARSILHDFLEGVESQTCRPAAISAES